MTITLKDAVITITGARGCGKSTLAATYLPPSQVDKVYVLDSENSMNNIQGQLHRAKLDFGRYVNLSDRFAHIKESDLLSQINAGKLPWVDAASKNALIGYYEYCLQDLETNLKPGAYKVVIIDTLEKLEAGMAAWVESNKKAAGVTQLAYGALWTTGVYPLYESLIAAIFARGVEVVILTSHLKTPWEGTRQIVGKVEPAGKKLLYRLSSLMLWLTHEATNADGAPAALVLKERLGNIGIGEKDEWDLSRRLPERIPHATWADIRRYLKKGCDLANPSPGEAMSDGEREMISELLSDAQMKLMILQAETEQREATIMPTGQTATFTPPTPTETVASVNSVNGESKAKALALLGEGKSKGDAARELGMTLPELVRLIK